MARSYHDYLFVMSSLDIEWSRIYGRGKGESDPVDSAIGAISEWFGSRQNGERPELYCPKVYLPFGMGDLFTFAVVNDFDDVSDLSAGFSRAVEELAIGMCPKIDVVAMGLAAPCDLFRDRSSRRSAMFVRFKLGTFAGLVGGGEGLTLVENYLASKLGSALEGLLDEPNQFLSSGDIRDTEFSIVELQGQEEVGVIFLTPNLSVSSYCVAIAETLCVKDVYSGGDALRLRKNFLWSAATRLAERFGSCESALFLEPIFERNFSSAGFDARLLRGCERVETDLSGLISLVMEFEVGPGHQFHAEEILKELAPQRLSGSTANAFESQAPVRWTNHMLGSGDLLIDGDSQIGSKRGDLMELRHCVDFLQKIYQPETELTLGRHDIKDLKANVSFPVPLDNQYRSRIGAIESRNFDFIDAALSEINTNLFSRREEDGGDHLARLKTGLAEIHLPIPVARSVTLLFQNFTLLICSKSTVEIALDLCDSFEAFFQILVSELPSQLRSEEGQAGVNLDHGRTAQIAEIAEVLQDALSHRLYRAFPADSKGEWAIDFRGGLNQLMYAADACLKCGHGLLRHSVRSSNAGGFSVGVLAKIGLTPGINMKVYQFGDRVNSRVATFNMDVPHLLNVSSYVDYFHESFHLAYSEVGGLVEGQCLDETDRVRAEEMFSNACLFRLLRVEEDGSYLQSMFRRYGNSERARSGDIFSRICDFVEVANTLYLSALIARSGQQDVHEALRWDLFVEFLKNSANGIELFDQVNCIPDSKLSVAFWNYAEGQYWVFNNRVQALLAGLAELVDNATADLQKNREDQSANENEFSQIHSSNARFDFCPNPLEEVSAIFRRDHAWERMIREQGSSEKRASLELSRRISATKCLWEVSMVFRSRRFAALLDGEMESEQMQVAEFSAAEERVD